MNKYQEYIPKRSNILVLAPHPDDEVIGCGGTLLLHKKIGSKISCVFLNRSEGSIFFRGAEPSKVIEIREAEVLSVAGKMGISETVFLYDINKKPEDVLLKKHLSSLINVKYRPEIIFIPWYGDDHPDHLSINQYLSEAELDMALMKNTLVIGYEVWTPIYRPNLFSNVTEVFSAKIEALKIYSSVGGDTYYADAVCAINKFRSLYLGGGCGYSESFLAMPLREYILHVKSKMCPPVFLSI